MKYAIISDVHANLEALERVLRDAETCGATSVVCLGDVVGYGPRPAETLEKVRATCAVVLAGNHDDAVSGRVDAANFIDLAADAVRRHREALPSDDRAWLAALPYTAAIEGALCVHGDLVDPPAFNYIATETDAAANFNATEAALVFFGHTHVPGLFLTGRSGTVYRTAPQDFTLEPGKRYLVNPGSVGYPRESNGACYSSYVLYDSDEHTVTFRFLPFSVASVMQRGATAASGRGRGFATATVALAAVLGVGVFLAWGTRDAAGRRVSNEIVAAKTLPLESGLRHVRANLELEKGSVPVELRLTFLAADGATNSVEKLTVRKSSAREWKIPAQVRSVLFEALKIRVEDTPAIKSFAPTSSTK